MRNFKTNTTIGLTMIVATLLFTFSGCKKELLVGSAKPGEANKLTESSTLAGSHNHVRYGRDYPSLDSTVRDSEVVITPNGPRLKSDVHLIPEGHKLKFSGTHLQEIEISTGKMIHDFGVQTPLKYIKSTSQRRAPASTKTTNNGFELSPATGSWATWAQTSTVKGEFVNGYTGTWTVPSLPTTPNDGQVVAVWIGLEDANESSIVQPAIVFGDDKNGGTNTTWSMTTGFTQCINCTFFFSQHYPVATGALITGAIQLSGNPATPTVNCSVTDNVHTSNLPVESALAPFTTLYAALERFDLIRASDYPPEQYVTFGLPLVQNLVAEVNTTPSPLFGEHTVVPANGTTNAYIYFHPELAPIISYTTPDNFIIGTPITNLTPTNSGAAATSYSITPSLPIGLSFNTTAGVISGTPNATSPPTNYIVTATNSHGPGSTTVNISVGGTALVVGMNNFGVSGQVVCTITPNIPSPTYGVVNWTDTTTGATGSSTGSPTSQTISGLTKYHTYKFQATVHGSGTPSSAVSNQVTMYIPF